MNQINSTDSKLAFDEASTGSLLAEKMLNKVPEVTIFFWIIKIMATTVGETAADFLSETLKLGLTITTVIMSIFLIIALFYQFKAKKYVPKIYWLTVVLISIVGTLITDNLTDNLGVSLVVTTIVFSIALIATFAVWYRSEKTLSIHSILTVKREIFYWCTVLFTFALGTAGGDLISEGLDIGYWKAAIMFAALILIDFLAYYRYKLNAVLAFWIGYILTRPFGASLGDFLSQPHADGGIGLGTVGTSVLFLLFILIIVIYLTNVEKDTNRKSVD